MKKISLLSILLLVTSTYIFAQGKNPLKAACNFRNLDGIIQRATASHALQKLPTPRLPYANTASAVSNVRKILQANQTRIARMRASHLYDETWDIIMELNASMVYTSQKRLGRDLSDFYYADQVPLFRTITGEVGKVYELPIEGIKYAPLGRKPQLLDPHTQVVFYVEGTGAQILDRKVLENSLYFEPVKE